MSIPEDRSGEPLPAPPGSTESRPGPPVPDGRFFAPDWRYVADFPPRPSVDAPHKRGRVIFLAAIMLGSSVYFCLWFIASRFGRGEEFSLFAASGLESLPFLPLAFLAYLGNRADWARVLATLYWLVLMCGAALTVWLLTVECISGPMMAGLDRDDPGSLMRSFLHPGLLLIAVFSLFGSGCALLIGLAAFNPAVRRVAARIVPIDPDSFVHSTALATVLCLTLISVVPLLVLGEPPLLLATFEVAETQTQQAAEMRSTVYGLLWLVPATVVVVGYPVRRSFAQALARIGLVKPRAWQVLLALIMVPVLAAASLGLDAGIGATWEAHGWHTTDTQAFSELMKFALNPLGAVVIGVTAGLGEELAVRGVLQPRLGIVLSNVFFTSLHALQYNWDALLSVFMIGLALGVIRKYTNTTTSAIVHGGFDFALVMLEVYRPDLSGK
jgi:hypothetical protein